MLSGEEENQTPDQAGASFSLIKAVLFAGIFGIIFGMFYVLISNAIQQRK